MQLKFDITSALEFYCYLKAHLPGGYEIISEPRVSYYSEWFFHYRIFHEGKQFARYSGSFLTTEPGYLVREAKEILGLAEAQEC